MEELKSEIIDNINSKLSWAIKSEKLMLENPKDETNLRENFWAFLAANQQAWLYFSKLINDIYSKKSKNQRSKLVKFLISQWKENDLSQQESLAWDTLQGIRNNDVHKEPALPKFEIKKFIYSIDGRIVRIEGGIASGKSEIVYVFLNDEKYKLFTLTNDGISAIKKLLEFIKNINKT